MFCNSRNRWDLFSSCSSDDVQLQWRHCLSQWLDTCMLHPLTQAHTIFHRLSIYEKQRFCICICKSRNTIIQGATVAALSSPSIGHMFHPVNVYYLSLMCPSKKPHDATLSKAIYFVFGHKSNIRYSCTYSYLLNWHLFLIEKKHWQFLFSKVKFQGVSHRPRGVQAPTEAGIVSCCSIYTFLHICSSASWT